MQDVWGDGTSLGVRRGSYSKPRDSFANKVLALPAGGRGGGFSSRGGSRGGFGGGYNDGPPDEVVGTLARSPHTLSAVN